MASLNKIMLIGNLGRDPEIRYTQEGAPVANFSLATTESYTDKGGVRQERTEWHNIVAWNKLAELAKRYLSKGRQVYVEGRLRTREWTDRDGNKRRTTEVVASQMVLLGSRGDTSAEAVSATAAAPMPAYGESEAVPENGRITDDDLPF
ncbi:MAG: single-stranded DNA-binding protein [Acidobacteria bacterium]|nr:single-stranded DNA-binding protein [Acidobacteriota bacterium]